MFSSPFWRFSHEMTLAQERVAAGAAHLDAFFGGIHWAARINLRTLNVRSNCECPVAQLKGTYNHGVRRLGITEPERLGVFASDEVGYPALTAAWVPEIRKRQQEFAKAA